MRSADNYRLRPLTEQDLPMVLQWRNSDRIRSNMYTDHIIAPEEHLAWFRRIKDDISKRYDVFEHRNRQVGLSYLTELDRTSATCLWGFYLGENDLPPGSGTVMGYLALNVAFDKERIRKVSGEVLGFNQASRRFFQRLGFTEEGCRRQHVIKNGEFVDVHLFSMLSDKWNTIHRSRVGALVLQGSVVA